MYFCVNGVSSLAFLGFLFCFPLCFAYRVRVQVWGTGKGLIFACWQRAESWFWRAVAIFRLGAMVVRACVRASVCLHVSGDGGGAGRPSYRFGFLVFSSAVPTEECLLVFVFFRLFLRVYRHPPVVSRLPRYCVETGTAFNVKTTHCIITMQVGLFQGRIMLYHHINPRVFFSLPILTPPLGLVRARCPKRCCKFWQTFLRHRCTRRQRPTLPPSGPP